MLSYYATAENPHDIADEDQDEPACFECSKLRRELDEARAELAKYRCAECHKALPVRSLQLVGRSGPFCNPTCLEAYDRAMRDLEW